jgi:hypothetical protein
MSRHYQVEEAELERAYEFERQLDRDREIEPCRRRVRPPLSTGTRTSSGRRGCDA